MKQDNTDDILVVDLDGTVLNSDILYESFWSAVKIDWRIIILLPFVLVRGRCFLKSFLARRSEIDVRSLPYNKSVLSYIEQARERRTRILLVTATHQNLAKQIADHLGVFDETIGTTDTVNLKGKAKVNFLKNHLQGKSFTYMGDSKADLAVWELAERVITVNASPQLKKKVETLAKPVEAITTSTNTKIEYFKELRPHQWLKNVLVFLPVFAAHEFTQVALIKCLIAFSAFSMIASSVYIFNDLVDLDADRTHPRKKFRPIACGSISISHASLIAILLLFGGGWLAFNLNYQFFLSTLAYFIISTAYTFHLKRKVVLDICLLAGLYTMRVVSGSVAVDLEPSFWLLAFSLFVFLSLAAVKRLAELVDLKDSGKKFTKGRGYSVRDIPIISMICFSSGYASVLVMALYIRSPAVIENYTQPSALWGICCILLYWITRIIFLTNKGSMHDDPIIFAAQDRVSWFCLLLIIILAVLGTL